MSSIVEIEELGRRIRKLRLERRMTLKQVEDACGLSATHLSEIERGRTSPTIGALVRISRALRKDASYFIEAEERPDVVQTARGSQPATEVRPGLTVEPMTTGVPGSRIHAYRVVLQGGDGALELDSQELPGDALYLVRHGRVQTEIGDTRVTLEPGDAMQASFAQAHRLRPAGGQRAELIAVLTHPLAACAPDGHAD